MLMITRVEERWRSKQFGVWQGLQQDIEAPAMRDQNAAVSNFEPGRDYSKILRSKRGRKNRDFERHRSLAERYRYRRWREKRGYPDGLPRLRARTPCCKQLFREIAIIRKSFTLLTKMTENWVPSELQISRDLWREPSCVPESIFRVQKLPDQLH